MRLRYFNRIQNLVDNIFGRDVFGFGFISKADAVTHHVMATALISSGITYPLRLMKAYALAARARLMLARGEAP